MSKLILIGMPSCGKTTVGRILASRLEVSFMDTDRMVEAAAGMAIPRIFKVYGEECFRSMEASALTQACKSDSDCVIATGGGIVINPNNVELMRSSGRICFINRKLDLLQISRDRPLAPDREALKRLYEERINLYFSSADYVVNANGTPEETADAIIAAKNEI